MTKTTQLKETQLKEAEIKDIEEIELTYSSHMAFNTEDLSDENLELWTSGKVKSPASLLLVQ